MTAGANPSGSISKLINLNAHVDKKNPLSKDIGSKKADVSSSYGAVSKKVNEGVKQENHHPVEKTKKVDKKNDNEEGQGVAEQEAKGGKEAEDVGHHDSLAKDKISCKSKKGSESEEEIALELLNWQQLEANGADVHVLGAWSEQVDKAKDAVIGAQMTPQLIQSRILNDKVGESAGKVVENSNMNFLQSDNVMLSDGETTEDSEQDLDQQLLAELKNVTGKEVDEKKTEQTFSKLLDGITVNSASHQTEGELINEGITKESLQPSKTEFSQQQYNGKIHTSMLKPEWGEAFQQRVNWLVSQNIQSARIQVDPKELGPIEIKIEVTKDNQTHVVFNSHSGATRDMLEQQLPRLKEMLEQQGVDLADVDVRSGAQDQQQFDGEAGSGSGNGQLLADDESEETTGNSVSVSTSSINIVDDFA